jgi:hypothetical protein
MGRSWCELGHLTYVASGKERWECQHHIEVPWQADSLLVAAGDGRGQGLTDNNEMEWLQVYKVLLVLSC